MRFVTAIVFLMLVAVVGYAEDVIVKKDGSTVLSKIVEITATEIKYKKYPYLDGPTYVMEKNEVNYITYENGQKEYFEERNTVLDYGQQLMSDADLLRNYKSLNVDIAKSKRYKRVAWIGGGVLLATGLTIAGVLRSSDYGIETVIGAAAGGIGASALWYLGFNLLSNRYKPQRNIVYNSSLMEYDILKSGNRTLSASVDVLRTNNSHHAIGLGISYKF
ncbi:MAG: hypothetical protein NC212_06015 [Staphylococcus sp.]|nr:hypothetical protein [Staphylococcus sp.]